MSISTSITQHDIQIYIGVTNEHVCIWVTPYESKIHDVVPQTDYITTRVYKITAPNGILHKLILLKLQQNNITTYMDGKVNIPFRHVPNLVYGISRGAENKLIGMIEELLTAIFMDGATRIIIDKCRVQEVVNKRKSEEYNMRNGGLLISVPGSNSVEIVRP